MSPEGECKTSADTMSSHSSNRWPNQSSKDSSQNTSKVLSPGSESSSARTKRHRARKESKHYQTSDILESPQVYCRSNLGDKISDYEDLWTPETAANHRGKGAKLSSFRPEHRPDLLPVTRKCLARCGRNCRKTRKKAEKIREIQEKSRNSRKNGKMSGKIPKKATKKNISTYPSFPVGGFSAFSSAFSRIFQSFLEFSSSNFPNFQGFLEFFLEFPHFFPKYRDPEFPRFSNNFHSNPFHPTACVTSPIENLLSPSAASAKLARTPSSEHSHTPTNDDENTVVLRQNHQHAKNHADRNSSDASHDNQTLKEIFSPSADLNRLQLMADFSQESMLQQPRNRLGILLTPTVEAPPAALEPTPAGVQSKRSSPFYAEPADALLAASVIRRSQRPNALPKAQRHSEPPKSQLRAAPFSQMLSPIDSEKSHHISGSLDELKKQPRAKPPRSGRSDPWPVDSSWEFMQNDDTNDYDTDANWSRHHGNGIANGNVDAAGDRRSAYTAHSTLKRDNRLTINQIIAKRLPDLRVAELLAKTVLPASASPRTSRTDVSATTFGKPSRLSAYDNVERTGHSGYATSLMRHGSVHSDDGTVFSEPWDSSQWDSFMPNDGEYLTGTRPLSGRKCAMGASPQNGYLRISTQRLYRVCSKFSRLFPNFGFLFMHFSKNFHFRGCYLAILPTFLAIIRVFLAFLW